jgi:hypothetical protein
MAAALAGFRESTKEQPVTNAFETIDLVSLDLVTGGADQPSAPNQQKTSGNVGVTVPTQRGPLQVGVQFSHEKTRSDYAHCIDQVRATGGGPRDYRPACGLPNGQP